jgi:hypothetical protein
MLNSPLFVSSTPDRIPQLSMPLLVLDLAYLHHIPSHMLLAPGIYSTGQQSKAMQSNAMHV